MPPLRGSHESWVRFPALPRWAGDVPPTLRAGVDRDLTSSTIPRQSNNADVGDELMGYVVDEQIAVSCVDYCH